MEMFLLPYLKLCFLYQVINERFKLPDIPRHTICMLPHLRNSDADSILFERPAVNNDAYKFSFLLYAISTWNALPLTFRIVHITLSYMSTLSMLAQLLLCVSMLYICRIIIKKKAEPVNSAGTGVTVYYCSNCAVTVAINTTLVTIERKSCHSWDA